MLLIMAPENFIQNFGAIITKALLELKFSNSAGVSFCTSSIQQSNKPKEQQILERNKRLPRTETTGIHLLILSTLARSSEDRFQMNFRKSVGLKPSSFPKTRWSFNTWHNSKKSESTVKSWERNTEYCQDAGSHELFLKIINIAANWFFFVFDYSLSINPLARNHSMAPPRQI